MSMAITGPGFGLGDLLAIGAAVLYLVSKFLAFFTITYRGIVDVSSSFNAWSGSREVLNWLEIIVVVAVVFSGVLGALVLPALGRLRGIVYPIGGVLLFVLTLIALFDVRRVASDNGTPGVPGIGFVLGLLLPLAIIAGGVMKLGVLPGDDMVSLGGSGAGAGAGAGGVSSSSLSEGSAPFSRPPAPGSDNRPGGYGPLPQQGPYGGPPAGSRSTPPNAPGSYGMPPGGGSPGGYSGGDGGTPPMGVPGPYGASSPPGGPDSPGGYRGGPPPDPR